MLILEVIRRLKCSLSGEGANASTMDQLCNLKRVVITTYFFLAAPEAHSALLFYFSSIPYSHYALGPLNQNKNEGGEKGEGEEGK